MKYNKTFIFWLLSLICYLIAWPPDNQAFFIFFSLAPILYLALKAQKPANSFFLFYSFYFAFLGIENFHLFVEGYNLLALSFGIFLVPLFWSLPILIANIIAHRTKKILAFASLPVLYVLQEWFQYRWDLSFIWYHLGYALGDQPWMNSSYDLLGINGISFLLIAFNSSIAYGIHQWKTNRRILFCSLGLVLIFIIGNHIYYSRTFQPKKDTSLNIAVFSPKSTQVLRVKENLRGQIDLLKMALKGKSMNNVDLIIGPEGYLDDNANFPLFVDRLDSLGAIVELKKLSYDIGTPILVGAILIDLIETEDFPTTTAKKHSEDQYYDIYNGAIFIDGMKQVIWKSKQNLLPIAESVPFHKLINHEWMPWPRYDEGYGVRENSEKIEVGDLEVSLSICYEGMYPRKIARGKKNELRIILSNDWSESSKSLEQQRIYAQAVAMSEQIPALLINMNGNTSFLFPGEKEITLNSIGLSVNNIEL